VVLFIAVGLAEFGGGYLMGRRWRDGRAWPVGLFGVIIPVICG
jgi:drug/metabolite transporter superfamily protein YnfA